MIIEHKRGDVMFSPERHFAFGINSEGLNDSGLAGAVSRRYWPELMETGPLTLGETLTLERGRRIFHALVVHSLDQGGWRDAPAHIESCFNRLEIPADQVVASVIMGAGPVGLLQGADVEANLRAMDAALPRIAVYTL